VESLAKVWGQAGRQTVRVMVWKDVCLSFSQAADTVEECSSTPCGSQTVAFLDMPAELHILEWNMHVAG
jgi:hypothetical protein